MMGDKASVASAVAMLLLAVAFTLAVLAGAQDQSGFKSIDCGQQQSNYTDDATAISYVSDSSLIDTGVSVSISASLRTNSLSKQLYYVRSFPDGLKNCYTVAATRGKRYLIRARFMYGNYDSKNQPPQFDLYLGVTYWASIKFKDASDVVDKEIIHVLSSDSIDLCLVKTGSTTPFISAIELRPISPKTDIYATTSGSLLSYFRIDLGSQTSNIIYRYKDDVFDRLWFPLANQIEIQPSWKTISTNLPIGYEDGDDYFAPSIVMETAVTPTDPTQPLNISWTPEDPKSGFYIYLHHAEVQQLQSNESRNFTLRLNGFLQTGVGVVAPKYLYAKTIYSTGATVSLSPQYYFSFYKVNSSTLPPLLNAIEAYVVKDIQEYRTKQDDADAMRQIKSAYGLKLNWQGDPCGPETLEWDGVRCISDNPNISSISYLNLSSHGLTGNITSGISNLKSLQTLDLSYNKLTEQIPDGLAQLSQLKVLNLSGNNLTGYVPVELLKKASSGTIQLSLVGNPNLCETVECKPITQNNKKSNKLGIALGVTGGALAIILLVALGCFCYVITRRRSPTRENTSILSRPILERGDRKFTYTEVAEMTNKFQVSIGRGGFGTVYLGQLGDTQVAVKMLSQSSAQGYREFRAEAELLMRVHHRNLTSLIGYCEEGDNLGLVYEYMSRGNLRMHLSERNANTLSWEQRVQIAVDAAQGLDYLHKGCKPPMIHRDVKSTNILINEQFQGKVSDFGLSRAFPAEGGHTITAVAGTPGYLDPEYSRTNILNEKSDVYSFGIVLMELITCRPVIGKDPERTHIIDLVHNMLCGGDIYRVVDPRLAGNFNSNSAWKMMELARSCVAQESNARPTMSRVVMELEQCLGEIRTPGTNEFDASVEMSSLNLSSTFGPHVSMMKKRMRAVPIAEEESKSENSIILTESRSYAVFPTSVYPLISIKVKRNPICLALY
ncbi:hypothetical protein SAY87_002137 [Trapa incisa]|uniref:non-specific serine/threonine protein kinase n=1 Tax=Trapa incisa TaxID=236973 RepID=A0AAN7JTM2_9MYRT|nr:hypothetical protein SAY87_002137 [Trapa incisa]